MENIEENSITVMDNARHHLRKIERMSNNGENKISKNGKNKSINFADDTVKIELVHIKQYPITNAIHEIAKYKNIVLRLLRS